MPKRILSIICLTNAICKHKGLLFKLISTHTFNIHSTNTHACCGSDTVLYIIPLSCLWAEDNFSSQRISRQGKNSYLNTGNEEMYLKTSICYLQSNIFSCDFTYILFFRQTRKNHIQNWMTRQVDISQPQCDRCEYTMLLL